MTNGLERLTASLHLTRTPTTLFLLSGLSSHKTLGGHCHSGWGVRGALHCGCFLATKIRWPHCQNTCQLNLAKMSANYHEQYFPLRLNELIVSHFNLAACS